MKGNRRKNENFKTSSVYFDPQRLVSRMLSIHNPASVRVTVAVMLCCCDAVMMHHV